ncbi:hypothetical protein [Acidicapsa ligni]|uniref:hypothetical protein n=1 Tax=Acidicapsa ligni TaxID=542300 RepID=UPI0021DF5ECD|nr:hypothetical protein [Acidicapsa ligni]
MSFEEQKNQVGDAEVEAALKSFRTSIHAWSDEEFTRARPVAVSTRVGAGWMRNSIAGWALGCVIAVAAVGVPVSVHHQHVVAAEHEAAVQEQARLEAAAEASKAAGIEVASSVSDEDLLSHVDSDIAQAAPDAMQPLADLMSETTKN